jgi:2-dehydropantoate 2-reductase
MSAVVETSDILAPFFRPNEPKPPVVLIQNGIGIESPVQLAYPDLTIISGVSWLGVNIYDGGARVEHGLREKLFVGLYMGDEHNHTTIEALKRDQQSVERFVDLLQKGGSDAEISNEIQTARVSESVPPVFELCFEDIGPQWKKNLWFVWKNGRRPALSHHADFRRNSAWSSMCAISRSSFAALCAPETVELTVPVVRRTMLENLYVARALGYDEAILPASCVDEGIKVTSL